MRLQAYTAYSGTLVITAATLRPEARPTALFTAASIHEEFCAQVRALLEEHRHIPPTCASVPAAQALPTYFPTSGGAPFFALRELRPAGSPRDIDAEWNLEIMRLRYEFTIVILPAAWGAAAPVRHALERHLTKAIKDLFKSNNVPDTFIPGDNEQRPEQPGRTEIDLVIELGAATARTGVDLVV
jgi:hypothetical protein